MNAEDIRKLADLRKYPDGHTAEVLRACADLLQASIDEHGARDREPECNICQAVAKLEAIAP